jgi:hypothetical protein
MKNAYQRRRTKARVEKSARMKKLDAITLEFARKVIEEETGAPLDIKNNAAVLATESKLVARDDRKNPLISTFDWTDEAAQRILRVPAGFMRNQTQERVEELARERAAACRTEGSGEGGAIDLALVEEGIEIGKKMMAEMIATYKGPGVSTTAGAPAAEVPAARDAASAPAPVAPSATGNDYLNEVSALRAGERREA